MMNTLLFKYIDAEISKYVEPMREGTAKGDPIGLSTIKYKSTQLFLTNLKGKEIAEAVGVSYGLLRVWRTEEPYLKAIKEHTQNFAHLVRSHILDIVASIKTVDSDGANIYWQDETDIFNRLAENLSDIYLYSDKLMEEIYKQAEEVIFANINQQHTYMSYLGFIFALRKGYRLPLKSVSTFKTSPILVKSKKVEKRITAFDFIEALQKPWTPDKEKAEKAKISFLKEI